MGTKKTSLLVVFAVLAACSPIADAAMLVATFDDLPTGQLAAGATFESGGVEFTIGPDRSEFISDSQFSPFGPDNFLSVGGNGSISFAVPDSTFLTTFEVGNTFSDGTIFFNINGTNQAIFLEEGSFELGGTTVTISNLLIPPNTGNRYADIEIDGALNSLEFSGVEMNLDNVSFTTEAAQVPEPSSMMLLLGCGVAYAVRRRRRRQDGD